MYKKTVFFFLLNFIAFTCEIKAQKSDAELKSIWENQSLEDVKRFKALDDYYELTNHQYPDSALTALNYHLKLAEDRKNEREIFSSLNRRGNVLRLQQKYSEAMPAYERAKNIAEKLGDSLLIGDINGNIGNVHIYLKDYVLAIRYFSNALKIYQQIGNTDRETRILTNLGSVFLIIHNYELALDYYSKVLETLKARKINNKRTAIAYINMGWAFYEQKKFELARDYYFKGLEILERGKFMFFVEECYSALAQIFHELKENDKALEYALKSQALSEQLGAKQSGLNSRITEAEILYDSSPEQALKIADPLIKELSELKDNLMKKRLYAILYKCNKYLGRPAEALAMHELYAAYRDSVFQEVNQFMIIQEVFKRDNEVQIAQNELKNQREREVLKTRQFRNTIFLLSLFFVVVGVLIYIIVSNNASNKIKRLKLLQEIEHLKQTDSKDLSISTEAFPLSRERLEKHINRKINETDWKVLNLLLHDPAISNKEIADRAFMSVDGIGSSLRRMYEYFEVKETKYKKIALIIKAMNITKS